jgi:hypothetical protein
MLLASARVQAPSSPKMWVVEPQLEQRGMYYGPLPRRGMLLASARALAPSSPKMWVVEPQLEQRATN